MTAAEDRMCTTGAPIDTDGTATDWDAEGARYRLDEVPTLLQLAALPLALLGLYGLVLAVVLTNLVSP